MRPQTLHPTSESFLPATTIKTAREMEDGDGEGEPESKRNVDGHLNNEIADRQEE